MDQYIALSVLASDHSLTKKSRLQPIYKGFCLRQQLTSQFPVESQNISQKHHHLIRHNTNLTDMFSMLEID